MKKLSMIALAVLTLALSACGGSAASPTDKTPEGVTATMTKMRELGKQDKYDVVCDEYLTVSSTAMFKTLNINCGDVLAETVAKDNSKDKLTLEQISKTIKVKGNVATFTGADGKPGAMLYVGGHWRFDLSDTLK